MSLEKYINPDFTIYKKLIFLLITIAGIAICALLIHIGTKLSYAPNPSGKKRKPTKQEKEVLFFKNFHLNIQLFIEMMISATSVMMFACSYVIVNHVYATVTGQSGRYYGFDQFISTWDNSKDFILLLLICLSCVANTIIDKLIIPLKMPSKEQKASIRMLGMFYVIIILLFLNNTIGDESQYSPVMMYYLGLMIGRFIYFDASFMDFINALKSALYHSPLLIIGLLVSSSLSFLGFKLGYLLERNYYIVGIFYTHLFILIVLFILHNSRVMYLFVRKPKEEPEPLFDEYDEYDDYDDYDEYRK